ncbi:hypothetical protein EN794_004520 [Mesorhizobium sp. M00.F.Ca.ET.151.01.1.1]|uniref:hypothetical protein n=1 Tax=Stenotrophomonas pavanii TaxID=487698 RepID=UPI000CD2A50B|nr:hypothetical protein [Stenotrophomonas pavanii]MBN5150419.1 hypothetical protein [Stenotrophomonas maltophilia]TGR55674.1 hypothetical protein EN842_05175 [bacterium M00.F.Ca.ET.199.01.1.1]TGT08738.1 hypothetical protein EN820_00360 [bacterium M00.F.Ca.ET.177.01.1.1]TGT66672.1 hypothetical protein EN813_000360 [Mesorhizobium sp. M00.F.Ca.ET.170.01.1.1]TGU15585.1 hypothetical protein EN806_00360 [bacterium M00.F.Ca.ET.163.01.1.1]TGU98311.1 hypothetical protein EN794_004520 [Mesorhizobium sp
MSADHNPFVYLFGGLLASRPEPMTNAGRYLQQLETGDARFSRHGEEVSDELLAGLRRIQITTAKESP